MNNSNLAPSTPPVNDNCLNSHPRPARKLRVVPSPALVFSCDICGQPVAIKDGIVQHRPLPGDYIEARRRWDEAHKGAVSFDALARMPKKPDCWQLGCFDCLKDIQEDYWFHLSRCANYLKALGWTEHLGKKSWFDPRDWSHFLRRHFLQGIAV